MNQPASAPFDDAELVAYIDGTLDSVGRSAIAASPEALARVETLRSELSALSDAMARALCPDADHLVAFLSGDLSEAGERAVGAHVAWCAECGHELVETRAFLHDIAGDLPRAPNIADELHGLRWLVASLGGALGRASSQRASRFASQAFALPSSGLRGVDKAFSVEGVRIDVTVEDSASDPALGSVSVLVDRTDGGAVDLPLAMAIELLSEAGAVHTAELDDINEVVFERLARGAYSLVLRSVDARILLPGILI